MVYWAASVAAARSTMAATARAEDGSFTNVGLRGCMAIS
jgi:hypothetical protein